MTDLAPLLTAFLRDHLPRERGASVHTVAAYSDAFALLLRFLARRFAKPPSALAVEDIDPDAVLAFLDHLESERGVSIATRNARLSAIRAFFRYVEFRAPVCLELALRIRALPQKKAPSKLIHHLDRTEIAALLAAPDRTGSHRPERSARSCDAASRLCDRHAGGGAPVDPAGRLCRPDSRLAADHW